MCQRQLTRTHGRAIELTHPRPPRPTLLPKPNVEKSPFESLPGKHRALEYLINQLSKEALNICMSSNINKTVCMIVKPIDRKYIFIGDFPLFTACNQILSFASHFNILETFRKRINPIT